MTLHAFTIWLLVAAFAGAGVFNAIGTSATRDGFVRWGFPAWWHLLTGLLELATALLIAFPTVREQGLVLGSLIIVAAVVSVSRARDYSHLIPLAVFAALLVGASVSLP